VAPAVAVENSVLEDHIALAAAEARVLRASNNAIDAIGIVGSTALGRCDIGSDIDLVAIVAEPPGKAVTSRNIGAVRIDVEWLRWDEAVATASQGGWAWELRKSARLGAAVPLYDPSNRFADLARCAAAARPDLQRYATELQAVRQRLAEVAEAGETDSASNEPLRGVLDSLALLFLLTTPNRYQKAKWTIEDLIAADESLFASALIGAYGFAEADQGDATRRIRAAEDCLNAVFDRLEQPAVAALVAMGYAPEHVEASYCARTLADARDLARVERYAEAAYVAGFAARLAIGMLRDCASGGLEAMAATAGFGALYAACFGERRPRPGSVAIAGRTIDRCADWLIQQGDRA